MFTDFPALRGQTAQPWPEEPLPHPPTFLLLSRFAQLRKLEPHQVLISHQDVLLCGKRESVSYSGIRLDASLGSLCGSVTLNQAGKHWGSSKGEWTDRAWHQLPSQPAKVPETSLMPHSLGLILGVACFCKKSVGLSAQPHWRTNRTRGSGIGRFPGYHMWLLLLW